FYPLQAGAIAALTGPQEWLAERNDIYRRRRDVVVEGLRAAGFQADPPKASLYVWARIPEGWTSEALSTHVLETAHIWLTPGIAFGEHGEGYVRVALTTDAETLARAMERVAQVLS
ncbi:aminotransferase class I/II-fold pyridoxal phosphate-dependent enzyme, partial [Ardenticatena maritima]